MSKVCLDPQGYFIGGRMVYYPCGRCPNCRDLTRMQMAARFLLEKAQHPEYDSFFFALTYDESNVDFSRPFVKTHIDKFLQDVRNGLRGGGTFRYILVSEYGDLDRRPHYHFIVLTTRKFPTKGVYRLASGHQVRQNEFVELVRRSWPYGFVDDGGTPTAAAVMYTVGYALKEDDFSMDHEEELRALRWCSQHHVKPPRKLRNLKPYIPFRRFSLRPGIGLDRETVSWVYRYMYNDGVNFRFSIDLGSGFVVPVPGVYLDKFAYYSDGDMTFSYLCKEIRKRQFDTVQQEALQESVERCSDGSLARSVRLARIKKRKDEKIQKALSQSLNIYRNEF